MDNNTLFPIDHRHNYFWPPFFIMLGIAVVIMAILCIDTYSQNCSLAGNHNQWKAVFVTNSQVYFGKVVSETPKTIVLRNVYYLQIQPMPVQSNNKAATQTQYNLLSLEDAVYGPTSEMRINREQILFIESLRSNSDVIKTIQKLSPPKK